MIVTWEAEREGLLANARPKDALVAFERSLVMREKAGADDPSCSLSLSGLGRAQKALGQTSAAKTTLKRAIALLETSGLSEELLAQAKDALTGL